MPNFADIVQIVEDEFRVIEPASQVPDFLVGINYRHEQRAPGDVVFVSPGGAFENPVPGAGLRFDDSDSTAQSPMLMHRVISFECDCWGADESAAETLMEAIIRAMDRSLSWSNFSIDSYDAVTEQEDDGGYSWLGFAYRLFGSFNAQMLRDSYNTVTASPEIADHEYE